MAIDELSTATPADVRPDEEWFQPDPAVQLEAAQVARELDYDPVVAMRLVMLDHSAQEVTDYLNPSPQHISHPDETVPGMSEAAAELAAGVSRGERVAIYADYDVDGQTSLAILSDTLESYGAALHTGSANAVTGFGLTREFVESAADAGCQWLITVDCGSTQVDPVKLAQSRGMRVIVIDHHDVDVANTAEHHLNPRLAAAQALQSICDAVETTDCRQKLAFTGPYDEQADRLTDRSVDILKAHFGTAEFEELRETIREHSHPTNTGALLTWKFAAAFHLVHHKQVPAEHWGSPLYLAGLGAIADLAPCSDIEVRAAVRVPTDRALQRDHFHNRNITPLGLQMLCDELGEDVMRPDNMIRSRALCNLPKRTSQIRPEDIQTLLRSDDESKLRPLIPRLVADYERLSAIRREEMDPDALEQVAEAAARGEETYFAYAVLEGYTDYAGYTRMVANTLSKETGKPAVAFASKGVDEFGQELFKFSGANDCVPDCHLGDLIHDSALQEACMVQMRDWLGEEAEIVNLGGHTAVVSGVVTRENIPAAQAAFEGWASEKDHKGLWRPIERKRPRVTARKVGAARLRRLEREAEMLAPLSFPEQPALQVSVVGQLSEFDTDPATGGFCALLTLEDGTQRDVRLSDELAAYARMNPGVQMECIIALGKPGPYYIGRAALV